MLDKKLIDNCVESTRKVMDACNEITELCREINGDRRTVAIYNPYDILTYIENGIMPITTITDTETGRQGYAFYEDAIRCYYIITNIKDDNNLQKGECRND